MDDILSDFSFDDENDNLLEDLLNGPNGEFWRRHYADNPLALELQETLEWDAAHEHLTPAERERELVREGGADRQDL